MLQRGLSTYDGATDRGAWAGVVNAGLSGRQPVKACQRFHCANTEARCSLLRAVCATKQLRSGSGGWRGPSHACVVQKTAHTRPSAHQGRRIAHAPAGGRALHAPRCRCAAARRCFAVAAGAARARARARRAPRCVPRHAPRQRRRYARAALAQMRRRADDGCFALLFPLPCAATPSPALRSSPGATLNAAAALSARRAARAEAASSARQGWLRPLAVSCAAAPWRRAPPSTATSAWRAR